MNNMIKTFCKINLGLTTMLFFLLPLGCSQDIKKEISLAGNWTVVLDSLGQGSKEKWYSRTLTGKTIALPGTLDDAGIGTPNTLKPELNNYVLSNLTRKHQYIGKAWYQKEVEIPGNWTGKEIRLTLERVIWESTVFVDEKKIGKAESLIGSHDYDLTEAMPPGKHLLTICIDNGNKYPMINVTGSKYPDPINQDMAHAYTNHTQIKWNGIIGDILLRATEQNAPTNLQIYPDLSANALRIAYQQKKTGDEEHLFEIIDGNGRPIYARPIQNTKKEGNKISFQIERPQELEFWDEFHPNLYEARVIAGTDTLRASFGYKEVAEDNGILTLNGRRIFLRGNLECAIFPLTGYPPMKKSAWTELIRQAKNYGLNHLRFHSWCPPKAAFEAADEAGFYLQVELPHWSLQFGKDKQTVDFLKSEAQRILREYGNHPSFVLFSMGNELQGDIDLLNQITARLKEQDDRHLYTTTSFSFQKPTGTLPEPEDDFFITQWTDKGWIRGQGIFNGQYPNFNKDYSANSSHINIPLISHEIGQYSVYPDLSEISKYTGVLDPLNFKAVKNDLEKKGMLDLADDFTQASGKLAAMLYKEEIERALKTPGFDGFQLLQLQDFPGQGTALVGLLNAFWQSKGAVSAEEFSEFNSELVPLIRFEKAVYITGETFEASIEIANFFEAKENQVINWKITDDAGKLLKSDSIGNTDIAVGNNTALGLINYPINVETAKRLTVSVSLKGTKYKNSWHVWVYPKNVRETYKNIVIASSVKIAAKALNEGKKVLLNPDFKSLRGIEGRFVPVFWSPVHFPNQPATMGLLVDDKHAAFNDFPTGSHTDWQWWDLCINSKSIITDSLTLTPLVRVVDNFVTNHHLSNLFEAKVGDGKLIFSSIDLMSNLKERPVARQLRHSLLKYMETDAFNPTGKVTVEDLKAIQLTEKKDNFSTEDIYD